MPLRPMEARINNGGPIELEEHTIVKFCMEPLEPYLFLPGAYWKLTPVKITMVVDSYETHTKIFYGKLINGGDEVRGEVDIQTGIGILGLLHPDPDF